MCNAPLGQWIDWDTTDVLMSVRIVRGVPNQHISLLVSNVKTKLIDTLLFNDIGQEVVDTC